jgi:hypothetical protein
MRYHFEVMDGSGDGPVNMALDFDTLDKALEQAHIALAEMARDGLPKEPINMMTVEVFDADQRPLTELRLTFEVIPKSAMPQT